MQALQRQVAATSRSGSRRKQISVSDSSVRRARYSAGIELRATISMARLRRDQGRRNEDLREFLAPVYGRFTEGFDTRDLSGAKASLEEFATP